MDKKKMILSLGGQEFRLSSVSDEAYMGELAASVNARIGRVRAQYPNESASRCALIAMLGMADELNSLRAEYADVDRKISELRELRAEPKVQAPVKRPFERAVPKKPVGV